MNFLQACITTMLACVLIGLGYLAINVFLPAVSDALGPSDIFRHVGVIVAQCLLWTLVILGIVQLAMTDTPRRCRCAR